MTDFPDDIFDDKPELERPKLFTMSKEEGKARLAAIAESLRERQKYDVTVELRRGIKASVIEIIRECEAFTETMHNFVFMIMQKAGLTSREIYAGLFPDEGLEDEWPGADTIPVTEIDGSIARSGSGENSPRSNLLPGIPRWVFEYPRVEILEKVIKEFGIEPERCMHLVQKKKSTGAKKSKKKVMELAYEAIVIPELGKIVLVCNKEGNATFIIRAEPEEAEKYCEMDKDELNNNRNITPMKWKRIDEWTEELRNILIAQSPRAYFRPENKERIARELRAFAAKIRGGIDVKEIPEWLFPSITIVDEDGKEWTGQEYIERAAIELGIVRNTSRVPQYEMKERLLKLAGIIST